MKYYFKSNYTPCFYSENWYGCLDLAPNAIIEFYDDNNNFCIGYVESEEAKIILEGYETITVYATEVEAQDEIALLSVVDDNVWFGERLATRWIIVEPVVEQVIDDGIIDVEYTEVPAE
jgi:hypothetical protein